MGIWAMEDMITAITRLCDLTGATTTMIYSSEKLTWREQNLMSGMSNDILRQLSYSANWKVQNKSNLSQNRLLNNILYAHGGKTGIHYRVMSNLHYRTKHHLIGTHDHHMMVKAVIREAKELATKTIEEPQMNLFNIFWKWLTK